MFWNQEKFLAATKVPIESHLATFHALSGSALDGGANVIALHVATAKT